MTVNFELTSGKNRALVCYCSPYQAETIDDVIKGVFLENNVEYDTSSGCFSCQFSEPQTALNIALYGPVELYKKGDFEGGFDQFVRRLRVGGAFNDVCVGVFFYNAPQPVDTRGTMAEVNEFFGEDIAPEPPSITSLVCDALRETFGGVYGASAFVIPNDITSYVLEVE